MSHPVRTVGDVLLGWRCPVCGRAGRIPCAACHASMRAAGPVPAIDGVDHCVALLSYRGTARELVARLKFRNQRAACAWLGRGMAELVREQAVDIVTWAPANPAHVRARGFDHGALLAKVVARCLSVPAEGLLERGRGASLTGRSAGERVGGPPLKPRFVRGRTWPLMGRNVLLVDDVITTGATLSSAAQQLRSMGAASILAVAAAHTPLAGTLGGAR